MKNEIKTKEQIMAEMEAMREKLDELKKCREDFQAAQKRHEQLLEATPDALLFVNRKGLIVRTNARVENLFGYTQEELHGASVKVLIPERFHAVHERHVERYFAQPLTRLMGFQLNIYALKKNGLEFPADISLSPLQTDKGLLVIVAIRDITRRKDAEEKIERNFHMQRVISSILKISLDTVQLHEQLERILDLILSVPLLGFESKGAIYLVEDDPSVLVMKAHRGISDVQLDLCSSLPFGKCLCGKAAEARTVEFAEGIDNRHEIQYDGMPPHGHYCVPVVTDAGTLGLISVFLKEGQKRTKEAEDFLVSVSNTLAGIIERKRAETALLKSEEKFRTLVENVNIGVYRNTGGPRGRFLQANPALAKIFGYDSVDEIMQVAVSDLYQNPAERLTVIEEVIRKGMVKDRELRLKKKDGTPIWAAFTAKAHFDQQGTPEWFDGVVEDITDRKLAEIEKQELQEQLYQAEKLSALGRLTANVAHEIRNPLTVIGGFARRLNRSISRTSKEKEYAESIISEVSRLEKILFNVLTLSGIEKPQFREHRVQDIIDPVIKLHEEVCSRKSIELHVSYADLPNIMLDKDKALAAIDNIMSNAIDAMPKGGVLRIQATEERISEHSFVVVSISDTGGGIPEDRLSMIYEPFFTTKVSKRGDGLGLPITKKIIEDHGGFMQAESILGKGSVFRLYFPCKRASSEKSEKR